MGSVGTQVTGAYGVFQKPGAMLFILNANTNSDPLEITKDGVQALQREGFPALEVSDVDARSSYAYQDGHRFTSKPCRGMLFAEGVFEDFEPSFKGKTDVIMAGGEIGASMDLALWSLMAYFAVDDIDLLFKGQEDNGGSANNWMKICRKDFPALLQDINFHFVATALSPRLSYMLDPGKYDLGSDVKKDYVWKDIGRMREAVKRIHEKTFVLLPFFHHDMLKNSGLRIDMWSDGVEGNRPLSEGKNDPRVRLFYWSSPEIFIKALNSSLPG